jgi:HEAT repeat protein
MTDSSTAEIQELGRQLTAADPAVRLAAAERLCRSGPAAAAVALPLVRACGDVDESVREQAVAALEELGAPPLDALAGLIETAAASDPLEAYWAITLLGRSGEAAAAGVSALARQLAPGTDPSVAQRAAWALGRIGSAAKDATGALRDAAASSDPRLARLAQEALSAVSG